MSTETKEGRMDNAARLAQALAYIKELEIERNTARLLGHRDGVVTAMLAVRRRMGPIKETLRVTPAHHVKVLASAQRTLDMLQSLDEDLDRRRRESEPEKREREAVEIVSALRPEPLG